MKVAISHKRQPWYNFQIKIEKRDTYGEQGNLYNQFAVLY